MSDINILLEKNKAWASKVKAEQPEFFEYLSAGQSPEYLWIGCADSRVPANEIIGAISGDIFVHRNIANMVIHTDINCLSVIQYAVDILKVKHIIVCGHYDCGGVKASMTDEEYGLIDNWLGHIKDVYRLHQEKIDALETEKEKQDLLCEVNVLEQVKNVCNSSILRKAWERGQDIKVHGFIYDVSDGVLKDLNVSVD